MSKVAQEVTDRIMAALESGIVPWRRPWAVEGLVPTSLQTGKPYQGINVMLLSLHMMTNPEYTQNLWVTYKQAQALGGNVRKGEKSVGVMFWSKVTPKDKDNTNAKDFMMARGFNVFNVAQCENLEIPEKYTVKREMQWTPSEGLERIADSYAGAPPISHQAQGRAYYDPIADSITMPPREAFDTLSGYAETLLHELTHSTGHASRLDRFKGDDKPHGFGSRPYAREELVAEIGAMMLMSHAGIEPEIDNGAAYIASWLKALDGDKSLVITAAARAQKAVNHILGSSSSEE